MRYVFGKQDLATREWGQEVSFLLTNGLGGYASVTAGFSVPRCDQGILVAAVGAPGRRVTLVHRLSEILRLQDRDEYLSSQSFLSGRDPEDGLRNLDQFTYEYTPCWRYHVGGVQVERRLCMGWERNTAAVIYTVDNRSGDSCTLEVAPQFKFAPNWEAAQRLDRIFRCVKGVVTCEDYRVHVATDAALRPRRMRWELLSYPRDAKDGRPERGLAASCCTVTKTIPAGKTVTFEIVFSLEPETLSGRELLRLQEQRLRKIADTAPLTDPTARALTLAADAYIVRREGPGGRTLLAGYPFFADWGRDAMIALPGCCLATGRYEDARSILRVFLAHERDGLVPNLFQPEDGMPLYNTVDASLLLIDCVGQYVRRTGDSEFLEEAWPCLERIIAAYRRGTHHGIHMDSDGLIAAGQGLDQVTWMDVCVDGILPTPRHGKPVEVNAYWYNALKTMEELSGELGKSGAKYSALAKKVKRSFVEKFYDRERGCLRDVLSGTDADGQIRCNQIWAVSMTHTMLTPTQERAVVDTVYRKLYTASGLRTLEPEDPQYRGYYGGSRRERDLAYHQGTVWVYPLGAFYRAFLKTRNHAPQAKAWVRDQLDALVPMLREGCVGQLPEIYDGDFPAESKGCFAQAWSVGEMLRVYEELEKADS